jgi:hypothetical protein
MKFLDEHFKIIVVSMQAVILLLLLSIKMNTCTLTNDMRTTKKVTKSLNETAKALDEKTITKEDLQKQTRDYLIQEKELDNVKTQDINKYLNKDSIK